MWKEHMATRVSRVSSDPPPADRSCPVFTCPTTTQAEENDAYGWTALPGEGNISNTASKGGAQKTFMESERSSNSSRGSSPAESDASFVSTSGSGSDTSPARPSTSNVKGRKAVGLSKLSGGSLSFVEPAGDHRSCLERPTTAKGRRRQVSSVDLYGEYTPVSSSFKSPTHVVTTVASSMIEKPKKPSVKARASSQQIECPAGSGLPPLSPAGSPMCSPGRHGFPRDRTFADWQDGALSPSTSPLQPIYPAATSSHHAQSSPSLSLQPEPVSRAQACDGSPAPMGAVRGSRRHQSIDVPQVLTGDAESLTGSFKSPR